MTLTVFLVVLFAALLHATWNAVIKIGVNRFQGMLLLTMTQGMMGAAMALVFPLPSREAWVWLLFSGMLHTAYKLFLAAAYEHGDLSRVYPIARGVAPMIVAVVGALFLSDAVAGLEYAGIILVGLGIMLMAHGVFSGGEGVRLLPLALASAVCTAGYSLVDGVGARLALTASGFTGWMFLLDAMFFTAFSVATRGRSVIPTDGRAWRIGALAGALSLGAYWIAVWAMTVAPIALVAALRETSVLFAMLIGIFWMRERADPGKLAAGVLIMAGIAIIRI